MRPKIGRCSSAQQGATRSPGGKARHDSAGCARGRWIVARRDNAAERETTFRLGDYLARWRTARDRRPSIARVVARLGPGDRPARRRAGRLRRSGDSSRFLLGSGERTLDRRIEPALADRPVVAHRARQAHRPIRRTHRAAARRSPARRVHNDLNDHNVLVGHDDDVERSGQRIAGIVDFGDMVYSYRVGKSRSPSPTQCSARPTR